MNTWRDKEEFKARVLVDKVEGTSVRKCLRSQLQDKLNTAARAAEWDKVSYYTGQIDLIPVMLDLPAQMWKRA